MLPTPVNPTQLGPAKGYSNGMLVRGDADFLFVAGQIAWDSTQTLVSDDLGDQFTQALRNVLTVVTEAGGEAGHIVRITAFVTDKQEYLGALKTIGAGWRTVLGRHFPAMSLVQVADLLEEGAKVELEATAAIPREKNA